MDKIDRRILQLLHQHARITNPALARAVGLSTSPCWARVRRLEKEGVIQRYITVVDQEKIGLPDTAIIELAFERHDAALFRDFEQAIAAMPEVIECMILFGEWDYVLTVVAHDVDDYQRFVFDKLSKLPNIATYRSTLIMRVVKHTTVLPV